MNINSRKTPERAEASSPEHRQLLKRIQGCFEIIGESTLFTAKSPTMPSTPQGCNHLNLRSALRQRSLVNIGRDFCQNSEVVRQSCMRSLPCVLGATFWLRPFPGVLAWVVLQLLGICCPAVHQTPWPDLGPAWWLQAVVAHLVVWQGSPWQACPPASAHWGRWTETVLPFPMPCWKKQLWLKNLSLTEENLKKNLLRWKNF